MQASERFISLAAPTVPNLAAATTCEVVQAQRFAPAASCAGRTQPALKGALAKLPAQELEGVE